MFGRKKQTAQLDLILEEITRDTKNKMKELSFSYEKVSQILKKMPASSWQLNEEEATAILGRVSIEVCHGCEKFYQCYKIKQAVLCSQVMDLLWYLERKGEICGTELQGSLGEECPRKESFIKAVVQAYEVMSLHKSWSNKMLSQRKAMASQMEEMSRILFGCSIILGFDKTKEGKAEKILRKRLKKEKVQVGPVRFYENGAKKQEVLMIAISRDGNYPTEKVAAILGRCLGKNMVPSEDCRLSVYKRNTLLRFEEDRNYYLVNGMAALPSGGNDVSGDVFSVMKLKEGKQVCILADGMGTGTEARMESKHVVELMEQFLQSGFREEETIRLANSMLTFGMDRSHYSSFDFFSIRSIK